MLFPVIHNVLYSAIRDAGVDALETGIPQVVGYINDLGWTHYDPRDAASSNLEPMSLCFMLGTTPLPLSETSYGFLSSVMR